MNIRNEPLLSAAELDFNLSMAGEEKINTWVEVAIGKELSTHCPTLMSCAKYVK